MQVAKQTVEVNFRGVDQRLGSRLLQFGRLLEARNTRLAQEGVIGKRHGVGPIPRTTNTGTLSTGAGLVSAGALVCQGADTLWHYDSTAAVWKSRGESLRAFPADVLALASIAPPNAPVNVQHCVAGGLHYILAENTVASPLSSGYTYRILDVATGLEVQPVTTVSVAAGSNASIKARLISAGGFAWLFYQNPNTTTVLSVAKFDPATPTFPATVSTYATATSGGIPSFHVTAHPTGPVVALYRGDTTMTVATVTGYILLSFLDTVTGAVKASPGWVGASGLSSFGATYQGALVASDWSNGFLYFYYSAGTPRIHRFSSANFSGAADFALTAGPAPSAVPNAKHFHAYYDAGLTSVVLLDTDNTPASSDNKFVARYVWNGSTVTTTASFIRSSAVWSEPFKVGSAWYLLTGHDDPANLQRAVYLRRASDAKILGRALYGRGGASGTGIVTVSGTTVHHAAVGNDGNDGVYHARLVSWDLSPTFGPMRAATNRQIALVPGSWPLRLGDTDSAACELVPPAFPRTLAFPTSVASGGATLNGNFAAAICYVVRDGRGNVYRSAPTASTLAFTVSTGNAIRYTLPTLRLTSFGTTAWIELYMTSSAGAGSLFLTRTIANDPTVDTITLDVTAPPLTGAETLYTTGNILPNYPAPPWRVCVEWKDRVFLTDTDVEGEVWPSRFQAAGLGLAWSASTVFKVTGGSGRVRAAGVVDDNYCAFFKRDFVRVIAGDGPNDKGQGSFTFADIATELGCENPHSVVGGTPLGCFYQATDGRIWLLGRQLNLVDIGRGMEDHRTATVTASVHVPTLKHVRFWMSSGVVLVFDYSAPTAEGELGQWHVWDGASLSAVAATLHGDTAYHLSALGYTFREVAGQWFDWDSTAVTQAQIRPKVRFPVNYQGFGGHLITYDEKLVGEFRGVHTLRVTRSADVEAGVARDTQVWPDKLVVAAPEFFLIQPNEMRAATAEITVEEVGTSLTEGFRLLGWVATIGGIGGGRPVLSSGSRL